MKLIVRLFVAIVAFSAGAAFAGKPAPPPPPPPPGSACVIVGGDFPAMAYSRGVFSKNGTYQSTQFFVANSLGTCEVMVYDTTDYNGRPVNPSFHFDFDTGNGTLAWQQLKDNGNTPAGRVVKVAQFHVSGRAVDGLPLSGTTIYRFPTSLNTAIEGVALSPDGSRVAFSEEHQAVSGGPWTLQVLICNVSAPAMLSACQTSVDTAFAVTLNSGSGGTHELTIGHNESGAERIYFIYRPGPVATLAFADLVAVDKLADGLWTAPAVVVNRETQYMASIGDTKTYLDTPSALSRPNEPDLVLISSRDGTAATPRVDVYDAGADSLTHDISHGHPGGYRPSWTLRPSDDSEAIGVLATPVLSLQPSSVQEIYLDGTPQVSLHAQGYGVDSAN